MTVAEEVRAVPIFAGLADSLVEELSGHAFGRWIGPRQVLFSAGEPSEHLFLIRSGRLRIMVTSARGDELVLQLMGPGEALGELSIVDGHPRSAGAEAVERTELLALPAAAVRQVLLSSPVGLLAVARHLAAGMRRLTDTAADQVFLDLPRRLAKLVLTRAEPRAGTLVADLGMSQTGIAAQLGVTRQSLNRAIGGLSQRGWISVEGSEVTVHDRAGLARFAAS